MEEITKSFENTYESETAYDLVAQAGDIVFDAVIDGGMLDGVPILGILKGAYKATRNLQLYRLMKKVHRFIFQTRDTSLQERQKFIEEYTQKNKENGCEVLLAVIEKLDNTNKVCYNNRYATLAYWIFTLVGTGGPALWHRPFPDR